MESNWVWASVGALGLAGVTQQAWQRLKLSLAKHPSLTGHSRMAKRVVRWIPGYQYSEERFFQVDGVNADVAQQRRAALVRLGELFRQRHEQSLDWTSRARLNISDLQFIGKYRVPFQFSPVLRQYLSLASVVHSSEGVMVTDLDGNRFYDLTGSYGVNLLGYDFYKSCMAAGFERAQSLGPVLGSYHPCVLDVTERLRSISGQEEVSFHMSGTEAVMQAVRLARYHTGRSHLVRFSGAYHGWWEDVQPGPGNPMPPRETYTLREMHDSTLRVLRSRSDIACVLVNPIQALHPNANGPADSSLVDSSRKAHFDRAAYTRWLQQLRQVCTERGIVLIFDEVFLGFRLGRGGAQAYFGVRADMVTYGKTLGGGLPVGVVCGAQRYMRRYRDDHPADLCFARGTFNAHPYVMASMQVFLERLDEPQVNDLLQHQDERWNRRRDLLNERLRQAELPMQVANMLSVFTVNYTRPSRYNWMLQFYMREQGLALSWIGTGRLIFSLNYTDEDFAAVVDRMVNAGLQMQRDRWWGVAVEETDREIRRSMLREMLFPQTR